MLFRRKSRTPEAEETPTDADAQSEQVGQAGQSGQEPPTPAGPYDVEDAPDGLIDEDWVDLGSLLVAPAQGKELRLQVDENSGAVVAVLIAAEDGALEVRAFAAPRNGDLWGEALPMLREDVERRGGEVTDAEGPWGPELHCRLTVDLGDGEEGMQVSRMIGINGSRWMLRATLLGRPALEPEYGAEFEEVLRSIAVRRGSEAMPKGEALPVVLPPQARRAPQD